MPRRGGRRGGRGGRRGRGGGRAGPATPKPQQDEFQLKAASKDETETDVMDNLPALFTKEASFEKHLAAQEKGCAKYVATLLVLQRIGTEVLQSSKARALAAAWVRKDKDLAARLLANSKEFGLVEVLKAATLLDSGRKMREWEKKLKRLKMQPKVAPHKIARIMTSIHNLSAIKPSAGSMSGAISRQIRRWVQTIPSADLEFYALHFPKDPWKQLADLVHFNPQTDFSLPWFLPYCFGAPAPEGTVVFRCSALSAETVNDLIADNDIPYAHVKTFKASLTSESKKRIAELEKSVDLLLWNYEDLHCPEVDSVIEERLRGGESIGLPYGKVMERLLLIKGLRSEDSAKTEQTSQLYEKLIAIAEEKLERTSLNIDSPVAVIGDRSPSMSTAITTSTIIASLLCAIAKAELSFFSHRNFVPPDIPRTIVEVLDLAASINIESSTIPAASLLPYYENKKVIKTFIIATDEEENGQVNCDGGRYFFHTLFEKYFKEVYPAKLVFVSFLHNQHATGKMVSALQDIGIEALQFKLDKARPDLVKLGNLLGLLSSEAVGFREEVSALEEDILDVGLQKAIEKMKLN